VHYKERFIHALQLISDPIAMDDFKLEEMETVFSEYDVADCCSFVSESVVVSSMNSLYESSTDDSAFWKNYYRPSYHNNMPII